jgi:hypothetical protein
MAYKDTAKEMKELLCSIQHDLDKADGGNKAASQRVRTGTVKLEKLAKRYRKESIATEKTKGGKKPKAAAKRKAAPKQKAAAKHKAAPKKAAAKHKAAPKHKAKAAVKARPLSVKRPTAKLPHKRAHLW